MAARVVCGIIICVFLISGLFPTAGSRPNYVYEVTGDSKTKGNWNNDNVSEAYIEEAIRAPGIDIEFLNDKLPKCGSTPSSPSACHNMVIIRSELHVTVVEAHKVNKLFHRDRNQLENEFCRSWNFLKGFLLGFFGEQFVPGHVVTG